MEFQKALDVLLKIEGGDSDDQGSTDLGVTQYSYDSWRFKHNLPKQPVRLITIQEASALYQESYWLPLHLDAMPDNWALFIFIQGVILPWRAAIQVAQGLLMHEGIYDGDIDGLIGPMTLAAMQKRAGVDDVSDAITSCIGYYAITSKLEDKRGLITRRLQLLREALYAQNYTPKVRK